MDRKSYEEALLGLDQLLESGEERESMYQKWLEEKPAFFQIMSERPALIQPRLEYEDGFFQPDFMLQLPTDLWEIWELKTPHTRVLKERKRRSTFYSEFNSYIAQCQEYSAYFDDGVNRKRFIEKNRGKAHRHPGVNLVAGRSQGLDRRKIHEQLHQLNSRIRLWTYDDVRQEILGHYLRSFGKYEKLPGVSVLLVAEPMPVEPGMPNSLFDLMKGESANRLQIFLNPAGDLCVRQLDSYGACRDIRIAQGDETFSYGRRLYVLLEIGWSKNSTYVSLEVNGTYHEFSNSSLAEMDLRPPVSLSLGSDTCRRFPTKAYMGPLAIFDRTTTYSERSQLRAAHLFSKGPEQEPEAWKLFENRDQLRWELRENFDLGIPG